MLYRDKVTTDPLKMLGGITPTETTYSPYALTKSLPLATKCVEWELRDVDKEASLYNNEWWFWHVSYIL